MAALDGSARLPLRLRARTGRVGGLLSLLGGVGTLAALFLPWLTLTLVSELECSEQGCTSTPDSASIRGLDVFLRHPFLFYGLLPLVVLSAAVNLTSGVRRLRAPRWSLAWSWGALVVTSAGLVAVAPWLLTYPVQGADTLVDGHITGYQYAFGLSIALGAGLVSLLGALLLYDQPGTTPVSPVSTDEDSGRAAPERRSGRGLASASLALLLVFAGCVISLVLAIVGVNALGMTNEVLRWWGILFSLVAPPVVAGYALAGMVQAHRRHQGVWLALLCLVLAHATLGWAVYLLSGFQGPPADDLNPAANAGMAEALLWLGYLASLAVCGVYAVGVLRRARLWPHYRLSH
jgi:hypothetical protein